MNALFRGTPTRTTHTWFRFMWLVLLLLGLGQVARAQDPARKDQTINFPTFNPNADFVKGRTVSFEQATASSGLPITYVSSNPEVASISGNQIIIEGVGTVVITATQHGNEEFNPAPSVSRSLRVNLLGPKVLYRSGDGYIPADEVSKPYFILVGSGKSAPNYSNLTVRYWLTVENDKGLHTEITYTQYGTEWVKARYIRLPQPYNGALGYVEYSFVNQQGKSPTSLIPGTTSGPIYSQLHNESWARLDEKDDYSFQTRPSPVPNNEYELNEHMTLYLDGRLIYGEEPKPVPLVTKATVLAANLNTNPHGPTISTALNLVNEGNTPLNYADLKVRYWFTPDGTAPLEFYSDWAKEIGSENVRGQFGPMNPAKPGASTYLELSFSPTLGALAPLSSTDYILYRIIKADWSSFNQTDDYSYLPTGPLAPANHITVYYRGALLYGAEPPAAPEAAPVVASRSAKPLQVAVLGNPVLNDRAEVEISGQTGQPVELTLYTLQGLPVVRQRIEPNMVGQRQMVSLQGQRAGVYVLRVSSGKQSAAVRLLKSE